MYNGLHAARTAHLTHSSSKAGWPHALQVIQKRQSFGRFDSALPAYCSGKDISVLVQNGSLLRLAHIEPEADCTKQCNIRARPNGKPESSSKVLRLLLSYSLRCRACMPCASAIKCCIRVFCSGSCNGRRSRGPRTKHLEVAKFLPTPHVDACLPDGQGGQAYVCGHSRSNGSCSRLSSGHRTVSPVHRYKGTFQECFYTPKSKQLIRPLRGKLDLFCSSQGCPGFVIVKLIALQG